MAQFCKHCKQKNNNKNDDFCCDGCKKAYDLVKQLKLDDFYSYRPKDVVNNKVDLEAMPKVKSTFEVLNNDGSKTLNLVAEGIECAACCWLIENALYKLDGVSQVKVNLFSKKVIVNYKTNLNPQDIMHRIYSLGYKVFPYSHSLLEELQNQKKKTLLTKMAVAAFFSMNIMLFSISIWFGEDLSIDIKNLFEIMSFVLAIPVVIYSGSEFFYSAINSIKQKSANMDVAISIAVILTFCYSSYQTFVGSGDIYFESSLMLIFFLLVGRFLEFKTKEQITLLAENIILADIKQTTVIKDGEVLEISSKELMPGDIILLQKGEKLATDAILLDNNAVFDKSSINGEIQPVKVLANQEVEAGCVLMSNTVKFKAINSFADNSISQIAKIIDDAKSAKGKLQNLAERISKLYVPVVHILSFLSFIIAYYIFNTSIEEGFSRAIAVLIITCPCALALAIPVANTALLSRLYKKGILVKNAEILERINKIKAVIYDKTGTLVDVDISIPKSLTDLEKQVLKSLTLRSKHLLSKKISEKLSKYEALEINDFQEKSGEGISALYQYVEYSLGSAEFCDVKSNASLVFKVDDKVYPLKVNQKLYKNVKVVTSWFKNKGFDQLILSGDKSSNVKLVANKLELGYKAQQKPQDKIACLNNIKQNKEIMYIGDGINDAASLAIADVSISFAKASEIAQNSADVIFQNNDLDSLKYFYNQALISQRRIKQNLAISLAYNLLAIPVAVLGYINPFFAALLMSSSSICVILNTIRK